MNILNLSKWNLEQLNFYISNIILTNYLNLCYRVCTVLVLIVSSGSHMNCFEDFQIFNYRLRRGELLRCISLLSVRQFGFICSLLTFQWVHFLPLVPKYEKFQGYLCSSNILYIEKNKGNEMNYWNIWKSINYTKT